MSLEDEKKMYKLVKMGRRKVETDQVWHIKSKDDGVLENMKELRKQKVEKIFLMFVPRVLRGDCLKKALLRGCQVTNSSTRILNWWIKIQKHAKS